MCLRVDKIAKGNVLYVVINWVQLDVANAGYVFYKGGALYIYKYIYIYIFAYT